MDYTITIREGGVRVCNPRYSSYPISDSGHLDLVVKTLVSELGFRVECHMDHSHVHVMDSSLKLFYYTGETLVIWSDSTGNDDRLVLSSCATVEDLVEGVLTKVREVWSGGAFEKSPLNLRR